MSVAEPLVQLDSVWYEAVIPPPIPPLRLWLIDHYHDRRGQRFDESQVPWVTAPNGPCDAIDNPKYSELWLQWAARTFKTTLGQALMMRQSLFNPSLMMFATRNENLCKQVLRRFYEQLDNSPLFRGNLPDEKLRNATSVDLSRCKVVGTWAGSKSGLADESILIGHANEVDKWEHASTSEEGDPLPRFLKRGGEFPDRKFLIESTPSQRGISRVEKGLEAGTNCRFWVPCPHCCNFQPIEFSSIEWEKGPDGRSDPDIAMRTAYYLCQNCQVPIRDEHRFEMVNRGVWVHAGCRVDHDLAHRAREDRDRDPYSFRYRWMLGEPLHNGTIYSSQLSVFYALFHGWGDMAADYLRKRKSMVDHRQWITEEAGETWKPKEADRDLPWEDLVTRLVRPGTARGVVPSGFSLLTVQFDRQNAERHDKPIPYMVCAWDHERRCHIVDYDYVANSDEAIQVAKYLYPHEDGGDAVRVSRALADSGFEPSKQQEICNAMRGKGIRVQLCKGSSVQLDTFYKESRLGKDSATPGEVLVRVDTLRSQDWVERVLHRISWDNPEGLSVYEADVDEHGDLALQLLNEEEDEKGRWVRIHRSESNDYRDCLRYGKICMERETRGRRPRKRISQKPVKKKVTAAPRQKQQGKSSFNLIERPGGWI